MIEVVIIVLEIIAGWFGLGLVLAEDARALAEVPIPYRIEKRGEP